MAVYQFWHTVNNTCIDYQIIRHPLWHGCNQKSFERKIRISEINNKSNKWERQKIQQMNTGG